MTQQADRIVIDIGPAGPNGVRPVQMGATCTDHELIINLSRAIQTVAARMKEQTEPERPHIEIASGVTAERLLRR